MLSVAPNTQSINKHRLDKILSEMKESIIHDAKNGKTAHEVETKLWEYSLKIGRAGFMMFLDMLGNGDMGEVVTLNNKNTLKRIEENAERIFNTVFGQFTLKRATYSTREKQKIEFVPIDSQLELPDSRYSYFLQDLDQSLAIENSFSNTRKILNKFLNFEQPVDSLERMNYQMSLTVDDFRDKNLTSFNDDEQELLVVSIDCKGIPIKRESNEISDIPHRTKGQKANAKQMATVGSIYTIDPLKRSPEEVADSLFKINNEKSQDQKNDRPRACNKKYYASLSYEEDGVEVNAHSKILSILQEQTLLRSVHIKKPVILVMDGQHCLWDYGNQYLPKNRIEILDLLHVTPRLWELSHMFNQEGSQEAEDFAKSMILLTLQGNVTKVIEKCKKRIKHFRFTEDKKNNFNQICNYLLNNQQRLRYDIYLKNGYPIASGVVEGACRHYIKDRMEKSGMRWTIDGAQAMLDLRSIELNNDWNEFQNFRREKEGKRLYPHRSFIKKILMPMAV